MAIEDDNAARTPCMPVGIYDKLQFAAIHSITATRYFQSLNPAQMPFNATYRYGLPSCLDETLLMVPSVALCSRLEWHVITNPQKGSLTQFKPFNRGPHRVLLSFMFWHTIAFRTEPRVQQQEPRQGCMHAMLLCSCLYRSMPALCMDVRFGPVGL